MFLLLFSFGFEMMITHIPSQKLPYSSFLTSIYFIHLPHLLLMIKHNINVPQKTVMQTKNIPSFQAQSKKSFWKRHFSYHGTPNQDIPIIKGKNAFLIVPTAISSLFISTTPSNFSFFNPPLRLPYLSSFPPNLLSIASIPLSRTNSSFSSFSKRISGTGRDNPSTPLRFSRSCNMFDMIMLGHITNWLHIYPYSTDPFPIWKRNFSSTYRRV